MASIITYLYLDIYISMLNFFDKCMERRESGVLIIYYCFIIMYSSQLQKLLLYIFSIKL